MKDIKLFLSFFLTVSVFSTSIARETRLLNDKWSFTFTPDSTCELKAFTKTVNLPHDWSIELPFDRNASSGYDGGYLPCGKGTYTKEIEVSAKDIQDSNYSLLFEGVYERWTLKINGKTVGFRPYGYSSVIYDITPYLHTGRNSIEVLVDNSHQQNSRYYSGSGIYRHVKLISTGKVSVSPWSLFITTPTVDSDKATVDLSFDIDGLYDETDIDAKINISDPSGDTVASMMIPISQSHVEGSLEVPTPKLWSPESPSLYRMNVDIFQNGKMIDNIEETFGIRKFTYSAKDGLRLNGKSIVLNGACVHHDHGVLGAASYDAAEARKVRLLKEGGFNAVRTSHNPPSPKFLDECDRQGLIVMDEAFDIWREAKRPYDYHLWMDEWGVKDIGDMVRRDRNHPSIMAWSIGNEIPERDKIEVISTARKLAGECRRLDYTRPVTEAICSSGNEWEIFDPHAEALDIMGYNYQMPRAEADHERCPERIIWQTESYPKDAAYNWHKVIDKPYIIGDFVWTGIDYLGESGIGRYYYKGQTEGEPWDNDQWPWHGSYCGDIDITGWRKPISHYRDMLYNDSSKLYMAVREPDGYKGEIKRTTWSVWPTWESWNWKGHEGKPVEVEVISRYPRVRLYLNDELIGEKDAGVENDCLAVFTVNYNPGVLTATGLDSAGNEVETFSLSTSGDAYGIRLTPDKNSLVADGQDLVYVIAEIVDNQGRIVPDAEVNLSFSLNGGGEIIATGSADMASTHNYSTPEVASWNGRALAVVRSTDKKGTAILKASSPGLKPASVKIRVNNN